LHIKRKHKGGNKSDRERYAREIFLALKNNKKIPDTKLVVPEDFMEKIKEEFERLKKIDFEEEFDPSNLFRYNISNFDEIMQSQSDEFDEDDDDIGSEGKDSISVTKKGFNESRNSDIADDNLSILSGARSEGLGRRQPLQQIMKDIAPKKTKFK
jgi:hypothetical protein